MLFNSFIFIFGFLPITFLAFYSSRGAGVFPRIILIALSLFFYAWWQPRYLIILIASIVFNYAVGAVIQKKYLEGKQGAVAAWLSAGVLADIAALGWFKYANFTVENLEALGFHIDLPHIALPLAISFFTFQKIAYLVDSARGEAKKMRFLDFALFATFFPQLIAGPITHYKEIVPQFKGRLFGRLVWRNVMVGLVIFSIGLFKKTVIADTLSSYVNPLYDGPAATGNFSFATGWLAAIAFTFQLYFDFSGYSDMAIGLARLFGIRLPLNFHSPLRARNIADYWRRWHMTLQRFIVAYMFQPLTVPLSRFAASRGLAETPSFLISVVFPLFITFVVIGIWHGAGWTFVVFGVMHATYICLHQIWMMYNARRRRALRKKKIAVRDSGRFEIALYHLATLVAVMFANVMFRAGSVAQALTIWRGMAGLDNVTVYARSVNILTLDLVATLAVSIFIVFFLPNTQQIMKRYRPAYNWSDWRGVAETPLDWSWRPSWPGLLFVSAALFLGVMFIQRGQAIFIYFNF